MKLVKITIMAIALWAILLTSVQASDRRVGGLILGGGTGALVGQAVGRNIESTIAGATVGGVLGLIIGNNLERHHGSVNGRSQVIAHAPIYDNRRHEVQHQPVYRGRYKNHRQVQENCRKIVTLQKGHNRTKRVVTTVCSNTPQHHYKKPDHFRRNDRFYR